MARHSTLGSHPPPGLTQAVHSRNVLAVDGKFILLCPNGTPQPHLILVNLQHATGRAVFPQTLSSRPIVTRTQCHPPWLGTWQTPLQACDPYREPSITVVKNHLHVCRHDGMTGSLLQTHDAGVTLAAGCMVTHANDALLCKPGHAHHDSACCSVVAPRAYMEQLLTLLGADSSESIVEYKPYSCSHKKEVST